LVEAEAAAAADSHLHRTSKARSKETGEDCYLDARGTGNCSWNTL